MIDEIYSLAEKHYKLSNEIAKMLYEMSSVIRNKFEKIRFPTMITLRIDFGETVEFKHISSEGEVITKKVSRARVVLDNRTYGREGANIKITLMRGGKEEQTINIGVNTTNYDAINIAVNRELINKILSKVKETLEERIENQNKLIEEIRKFLNENPELVAEKI